MDNIIPIDENDQNFHDLSGKELITAYVNLIPNSPGVYRMLGKIDNKTKERVTLYVGKAKDLKKRVSSYAKGRVHAQRLHKLVNDTLEMVFVTTKTESDALLLEANYIKKYSPKYNVLLKDDKYFPYLLLQNSQGAIRLTKHRGKKIAEGEYFGPFASTYAVNDALEIIKRAFQLRSCSDNVYLNRTRPCLLHFIKKCSAPCTGEITADKYDELVKQVRDFLTGKSTNITTLLSQEMEVLSKKEDYEAAAIIRDRLSALSKLQLTSDVNTTSLGNSDVIAVAFENGYSCIQIFFYRHGQNWGNRAFYPKHDINAEKSEIIRAFLLQFYSEHIPPLEIYIYNEFTLEDSLLEFLDNRVKNKITITTPIRGDKKHICLQAYENATQALSRRLSHDKYLFARLKECQKFFERTQSIKRIEIYDNAHISGSSAVGAFVVFDETGFNKKQYRQYKFGDEINSSDDYAMLENMIDRRLQKIVNLSKEDNITIKEATNLEVDVMIIDGGIGHINIVKKLLIKYDIPIGKDGISLMGIAKAHSKSDKMQYNKKMDNYTLKPTNRVNRSSYVGNEQFINDQGKLYNLVEHSTLVHFFQKLRDESHRFVNNKFKSKQKSKISMNPLSDIKNIGAKRKKALLNHFGSAKEVASAAIRDLEKIDGISKTMATKIYNHFNNN